MRCAGGRTIAVLEQSGGEFRGQPRGTTGPFGWRERYRMSGSSGSTNKGETGVKGGGRAVETDKEKRGQIEGRIWDSE